MNSLILYLMEALTKGSAWALLQAEGGRDLEKLRWPRANLAPRPLGLLSLEPLAGEGKEACSP